MDIDVGTLMAKAAARIGQLELENLALLAKLEALTAAGKDEGSEDEDAGNENEHD